MRHEPWATTHALVATGLAKSFGDHLLWHAIDFRIEPGEMVAITGPSGSGKSTLLNCIGMLEPLDAGSLVVGNWSLRIDRVRERRNFYRHGVGFLFQNYGLVESWTVLRNLNLALTYSRLSRVDRRTARSAAMDQLEIASLADRRVFTLSGGEQQRIALARLMLQKPRLILADEPTAALDEANARGVIERLSSLRDRGGIILASTHDPKVIRACDRQIDLAGVTSLAQTTSSSSPDAPRSSEASVSRAHPSSESTSG